MAPTDQREPKEIHPLKTWEELVEWTRPEYHIDDIECGMELQSRHPSYDSHALKTLVCHDMKGGYLDDRFYGGTCDDSSYRFYQWSGVDSFVYFSHNLVTIPPPCWVNSAHLHGVKVLGTFITEWDAGKKICTSLLASQDSVKTAVNQLVSIAEYHHLEGWLINIENEIECDKINVLVDFVKQLTTAMKESRPNSSVIWYDSVTKKGKLDWQNELNDNNRLFFDACDGIFLNYTWTNDHLQRSYKVAGTRNGDVYVGLDVFGRNFYEGGKFNTHKAMELARANDLSVAIFAQGWTYETQDDFEEAEERLWRSLAPYLTHHGPATLPFRTSFCQGIGKNQFAQGKCDNSSKWYNLSKQQYQPIWPHDEGITMKMITREAYNGGGCLQLTTSRSSTVRLFVCKIRWEKALIASVVYKCPCKSIPMSLVLRFVVSTEKADTNTTKRTLILPLEGNTDIEIQPIPKTETADQLDSNNQSRWSIDKVVDSEVEGWTLKSFTIPEDEELTLEEICVRLDGASTILLGSVDFSNICLKGAK